MSALRKTIETAEYVEARESWTPIVIVTGSGKAKVETPVAAETATEPGKLEMLKNMALFLSAPFVGLLYAVLLPFVGLGMLAWIAAKALWAEPKVREAVRFAGFMLALAGAPLIGLAYIVVLPFAGIAMLARAGGRAVIAATAAA